MTIPADRTFVDQTRAIIDPWLKVIERHDKKVDDLETRMTAAEVPATADETVNAFSNIAAFNEDVEVTGGELEASEPGATLAVNVDGPATFQTIQTNGLRLSIASETTIRPNAGCFLATPGGSIDNGNMAANRIYAQPIIVPRRLAFTQMGWRVRALTLGDARTGNWAMGLYEDNYTSGGPGVSLAASGTIALTANGAGGGGYNSYSFSSLTLNGGRYWLLITADIDYFHEGTSMTWTAMGMQSGGQFVTGHYRDATFSGLLSNESGSAWTLHIGNSIPLMLMG